MVEIKGLNKFYGKFIALNNLDLHIDKGELFGFVGPNGAGKTTTMKILSGLLKASGGEAYVAGIDAIRQSTELKAMIGYMPDFFGVYDNPQGDRVYGILCIHLWHVWKTGDVLLHGIDGSRASVG